MKYTSTGCVTVQCHKFSEPQGLRSATQTVVEIVVADTGCGIANDRLESIFREFEQVESSEPKTGHAAGLGKRFPRLLIKSFGLIDSIRLRVGGRRKNCRATRRSTSC